MLERLFASMEFSVIVKSTSTNWLLRHIAGLLLSVALGLVGGMICGAVILSLCGLSGRDGTTGQEYVGFWDWGLLLIGAMYGAPVGAMAGPIAYLTVLRTTGIKRAIVPLALGTILCGFAGSLASPLYGLTAGVAGFFVGLLIFRFKLSNKASIR